MMAQTFLEASQLLEVVFLMFPVKLSVQRRSFDNKIVQFFRVNGFNKILFLFAPIYI